MNEYLCIDIGGTLIKFALLDHTGKVKEKSEIETPQDSLEHFYETLDKIIQTYLGKIEGIAISMPGRINSKTGFVHTSGALTHYLSNTNLKEVLEKKYCVKVSVENDGKCAALAESWIGNLKGLNSGAVIILGTAIGGGIIINGNLWRGANFAAGEFSVASTDFKKYKDENGIWAKLNGVCGLLAPYAKAKNISLESINGISFFNALKMYDNDAKKIFVDYIDTLVAGILNVQSILDVEKYCIGGGISKQDILIDEIKKAIDDYFEENSKTTPMIKPSIERCLFGNDANLIGALKNYFDLYTE